MWYPNRRWEKKLARRGFTVVAGIDEVGRGAWAGPLVAAAVVLPADFKVRGIRDSKLLRAPQRQALAEIIKQKATAWALGVVEVSTLNHVGLTAANQQAVDLAVANLQVDPDHLLIDGRVRSGSAIVAVSIIDGDYKVTSIAAASIIAKVARDAMMDELAETYPQYGFRQHKGYGTALHHEMLVRFGACEIHRKSFEPIRAISI